jgi:hypothetical protein
MKSVPEIAPEIRSLLEEIVADPRSAIRLVPQRALRTWFDSSETVRASDIVRTNAERHLVECTARSWRRSCARRRGSRTGRRRSWRTVRSEPTASSIIRPSASPRGVLA